MSRLMATCHPEKPRAAKGLCSMCYQRLRRDGTTEARPYSRHKPLFAERDPDEPCCDVCAAAGIRLVRFNLTVGARLSNGKHTTRGAGAITLCQRCWNRCRRSARAQSRPQLRIAS